MIGKLFTNKHLKRENLPEPGKTKSSGKRAANISNGSSQLTRAFAAPKAFGEEVIGSTPIFSTLKIKALQIFVRPVFILIKQKSGLKFSLNCF